MGPQVKGKEMVVCDVCGTVKGQDGKSLVVIGTGNRRLREYDFCTARCLKQVVAAMDATCKKKLSKTVVR